MPDFSKKKKIFFYITMVLLVIVVSVVILEIFCALFKPICISVEDYFDNFIVLDEELGYKMADNFKGVFKQDHEVIYSTNNYGLRDREFSAFADKGVKRIFALGDSWTFGCGVELPYTWPKQLENILEKKGMKAEVINTGLNGYSTRIYYRILKKFYPLYHPDIVVVMACSNDPGGDMSDVRKIYPMIASNDSWLKKFLKKHSHLAKNLWFVYQEYFPKKYSYFYTRNIIKKDKADAELSRAYALYWESLIKIKQFCRENGISLVVTAVPDDNSYFFEYTEKLCLEEGIDYISQESLLGEDGIKGVNSAGHYSPKGYNLLANNIAEYLLARFRK